MSPAPLRYAISDRNGGLKLGLPPPVEHARLLAGEGVEFYQLREKDLPAGTLAALARNVLRALAGTTTLLLINGRTDVAVAAGAHGVHLTSSPEELSATQVHRLYTEAGRPAPLVTVSCHSLDDVARVRRGPLTAVLFGPVFGKTIEGQRTARGIGLGLLREACLLAGPIPVFALGGVTRTNALLCHEAGAAGIAGIRLFQRSRPGLVEQSPSIPATSGG